MTLWGNDPLRFQFEENVRQRFEADVHLSTHEQAVSAIAIRRDKLNYFDPTNSAFFLAAMISS